MAGFDAPQLIGCLAPQAGTWLHALAIVGFVLSARAIAPPRG